MLYCLQCSDWFYVFIMEPFIGLNDENCYKHSERQSKNKNHEKKITSCLPKKKEETKRMGFFVCRMGKIL